MSDNDNKPPDLPDSNKEDDKSSVDSVNLNTTDKCDNPGSLVDYKNLMLKNKFDLKKKEEEVQEYAKKLTKIKSKVKSRRSVDTSGLSSVNETMSPSKLDHSEAKTPSERSHLLQQKLEENRKIFEQRNKDLIESKRADEVKLEEIRQQLFSGVTTVSEDINFKHLSDDKDKKIVDLTNKVMELESIIMDLKDNLNNKDSVIESKTKAITLVSDNLSLKSKETLDQLEDTKDEMRNMQENFIKIESNLKVKIDSLIMDIGEKDKKINELEGEMHKEQESVSTATDDTLDSRNEEVDKLKSELDELNKSMIKIKAQNKSKLKNLQKRLDRYQKSADPNDQVVNLINQVSILEEEKGNLQLSLVDFDEIKATNQELQKQISDLSEEFNKQKQQIQVHVDALALLENEKLDLVQELEKVKEEAAKLKSENGECENLRVTAELKVVELEEQLELLSKQNNKTDEPETFVDNNNELVIKLNELQDKFDLAMQEKIMLEDKLNNLTNSASTDHDDQEVALMSLKTEIVNLKQLNEQQRTFIDDIQLHLTDNQLELEQKNKLLDHYEGLIDNCTKIQAKLSDMLIKIDDGKAGNDNVDISSLEAKLDDKNKLIDDLKVQLDNLNSEYDNLKAEKESIVGKLNLKYEEDINMLTKLMGGLNSELEDKKNQSDLDKLRIESLEESLRCHEIEIEKGKKLIEELNLKLEEKSEECLKLLREGSDDKVEKIDNLTNKILDKEQVIETFLQEKEMLEGKIHEETVKSNEQMWVIEDLNNQIYKLKVEMTEKEANLLSMLNEKEALESKWRHEVNENQGKLERLNELSQEIDNLNSKINDYETKLSEIANEKLLLENKIEENENKLSMINNLQSEIDALKNNLSDNENIIESLRRDKEILEHQLRDSENKLLTIDEMNNELNALKTTLADKDNEIIELSRDKEILRDELQVKNNELRVIDDLHRELDNVKMKLAEKDEMIESTLKDKEILEDQLGQSEGKLKIFNDANHELEIIKHKVLEREEIIESMSREKGILEELLSEKEEKLRSFDQLTLEMEAMKNQMMADKEMVDTIYADKSVMEDRLREEMSENQSLLIKIRELLSEIEKLKNELNSKEAELEENFKIIDDVKMQLRNQSEYAENLKVQIDSSNRMIDQIKITHADELNALNNQLDLTVRDLNLKLKEIDDLKAALSDKEKLIGNNITEEVKIDLENKIFQLERQLEDAHNNNASQLQKMKIIAANLKKKSIQCQEHEMKLNEYDEKWEHETREKDLLNEKVVALQTELEEKNKKSEELEKLLQDSIRELDDLKLNHEKLQAEFTQVDKILRENNQELAALREKYQKLEEEIKERVDEVERIERLRDEVTAEFTKFKEENNRDKVEVDSELEETKEKARELGVRMQVMESEYLEHLNTIQMLRTENGMLMSKHSQLNERLETTETDFEKKINDLENIKSKLEEESEKKNKQLADIELKLTEANRIVEELKLQNKNLEDKILIIEELEVKIKNLEEQIETVNKEKEFLVEKLESLSLAKESGAVTEEVGGQNIENIEEPDAKLVDEEEWGWNAQEAEIPGIQITPFRTEETQMQAKIAELQDTIKDLEEEKSRLSDELMAIQIKNGKLIRKVKEFKIHNENLSQQLKLQMNSNKFSDLDSAIEEELKSQVAQLEKNLNTAKSDNEKIAAERDNLLKRIDVLTAANESFIETKERQDRDIEVMVIRNKELSNKIHLLESRAQTTGDSDEKVDGSHESHGDECVKCKEKINGLQENLELLSNENEELRALIEHEKMELSRQKREIEESKNLAEGMKVNFYDMLEKSFTKEKSCLENLSEVTEIKENVEENLESTLKEERLRIQQLEKKIAEDGEVISKLNCQVEGLNNELTVKEALIIEVKVQLEQVEAALKVKVELKEQLEVERDNLLHSLQQLNDKIYENNIALEEKDNRLILLENNLQETSEELRARDDTIVQMNNKLVELQRLLEMTNEEKNKLKADYDQLADELKLTSQQVENLTAKARELEELRIETDNHLQMCRSAQVKCLDDLEGVGAEKIRVEETLSSLTSQVSGKHQEFAEKDLRIQTLEEDLSNLLKERDNYLKSYEETDSKLSEITDAMANVTELLNVRVQEVADLKQYIKKLEFDRLSIDDLNAQINNLNDRLTDKDNELAETRNKFTEELDDKVKEIISLQSKLEELDKEYSSIISSSNNHAEENKLLKEAINNNEVLIENLQTGIKDRDERIIYLQQQVDECNEEIQRMNYVIADYEESSNLSVIKIMELTEEVSRARGLEEAISEIKAEHQQTVDSLQNTILESKQAIDEIKNQLNAKDEEIEDLKYILNESTYPGIIQELQNKIDTLYQEKNQLTLALMKSNKDLGDLELPSVDLSKIEEKSELKDLGSSELDVALYMLHQRDVRCEELTHELMQLLEERDTLQLRLSNAIRVNEELRKYSPGTSKPEDDADSVASQETNDAVSVSSQSEVKGKEILAEKLSQLHNVGHRKDIRLKDERELRHTQQMSLIAHKEALSTLPPDAAARLINAKYTVSRDVQSQSSVLLNWLWGKSTPKVVHM